MHVMDQDAVESASLAAAEETYRNEHHSAPKVDHVSDNW